MKVKYIGALAVVVGMVAACSSDKTKTVSPSSAAAATAASATAAASAAATATTAATSAAPAGTSAATSAATTTATTATTATTVSSAAANRQATLVLGIPGLTQQFDPVKGISLSVEAANFPPIYDRLIGLNADLSPKPQLATSWKLSDDKKALTLELRQGVKFSDGTAFDAAAAKANLDRALAGTGLAKSGLALVTSVDVVSPTSIRLNLNADGSSLPIVLAQAIQSTSMASPAAFANLATQPVGSGPYKLLSSAQDRIIYQRIPGYWDKDIDAKAPERLEMVLLADDQARYNALVSGQIDAEAVTSPLTNDQTGDSRFTLTSFPSPKNMMLFLNLKNKPLDDVRVRKALSLAIDRTALSGLYPKGFCVPSIAMTAEGFVGYRPEFAAAAAKTDKAAAKQMLADAGVTNLKLKIVTPNLTLYQDFSVFVQSQLSQIGVSVDITPVVPVQANSEFTSGKYDAWVGQATGNADPGGTVATFMVGVFGLGATPDEIKTRAAQADLQAVGSDGRSKAYGDLFSYLIDNPMHIPLCSPPSRYLQANKKKIMGLDQTSLGRLSGLFDPTTMWVAQ